MISIVSRHANVGRVMPITLSALGGQRARGTSDEPPAVQLAGTPVTKRTKPLGKRSSRSPRWREPCRTGCGPRGAEAITGISSDLNSDPILNGESSLPLSSGRFSRSPKLEGPGLWFLPFRRSRSEEPQRASSPHGCDHRGADDARILLQGHLTCLPIIGPMMSSDDGSLAGHVTDRSAVWVFPVARSSGS
jgi:hypothetical protein